MAASKVSFADGVASSDENLASMTPTELLVPSDSERFYVDMEFLQNLSNARYLHYLAINKYFENQNFMNYLQYLTYWKQPLYMKFLMFPHSLAFLDALLTNARFRQELTVPQFIEFVHIQQGAYWMLDEDRLSKAKVINPSAPANDSSQDQQQPQQSQPADQQKKS